MIRIWYFSSTDVTLSGPAALLQHAQYISAMELHHGCQTSFFGRTETRWSGFTEASRKLQVPQILYLGVLVVAAVGRL